MKKVLLLLTTFLIWSSCTYDKGEVPVKEIGCDSIISYSAQIAPLVTTYCNGCHVAGGPGSGDFTSYAGLKLKADNGTLKNRVVDLKDMPQAGSPTLSDDERNLIRCWIAQGAPEN
jgi:uncharacterized membrane protein